MSESAGYPSDLSDRQWALIEPFLRVWKTKRPSPSGHEGRYELREIVNAIFYQNRTGCQWAYLPNDVPPWSGPRPTTTTSRYGVTMAPIRPSTICCAARRGSRPAAPRIRP